MADITSRDFQELIKRQKETTDSLQTIIQQNERSGDASERFKDALPEIANDTRLAVQRESFDKKEGITETDNLQRETTEEVIKLQKIQTQGIDETNEQKEEQSELQQQILEANKKGFLTFGERIKFFALGVKESITKSNEDKKDEKRDRSKLLTSVQNLGKGILGAITSPIETTFKSIGAILKNLITGGLLLTALLFLQKFINSDMWPKFIEGLKKTIRATIEITKSFFAYVEDLYTLFKEEGLGAVVSKLFTDTTEALGDFKKTFLIGIGVAVAAFAAAIYFAISTATSMVRGLGGMMGFGRRGSRGAGKTPRTSVRPDARGTSKMDMGKKQTIKPDKPTRMPGLKNVAKGGLRVGASALRTAGLPGFIAGSVAISAIDAVSAFGNANELFGKEANKFEKILAGGAGAVEGFTFGLIKAEDLIDTPGDKIERYAKQVEKSQLSFERFEKFQQKRLQEGDITQEQFDKLIEQKRVATVESMKKNNEKIKKVMDKNNKILEKSSIRQVEKINELVELMKDNKKLVAEKENQTASFMMAGGNTNITTNPTEKTIVMDTSITDSFHSQVHRQSYG